MPLLMCPNCNLSTQQVRRHEIEIDMCPQCRGVWMDRGELEKILDMERGNIAPAPAVQDIRAQPAPNAWPDRLRHGDSPRDRRDDDDDDRRRVFHGDDKRYGQKRRGSIFDFFDD